MPVTPLPLMLFVAMAIGPLGAGQQDRLAAWLQWATAYRACYEPAPFSLRIDEAFTARCIAGTLRRSEPGSPEQRAVTEALIAATPELVELLNTPVDQARGGKKAAGIDPAPGIR